MTSLSIVQMTLSVDSVTIYLPTQCQLCVLYPIYVTHMVGTHNGHMIRRKFQRLQASASTRWLVRLTPTTSTLVSSCSSGASSRHRTMSDLVPSLSFPLTDSDGGHG